MTGRQPFTRVSTIIAPLDDPYGLVAWQKRQLIKGLGARSDLFARGAAAAAADNRAELDEVAEAAIEAARSSEGANVGTAVHSFTQQLDEGRKPNVPDPWRAPVDAYRRAMDAAGLVVDPEWIEATVHIADLDVAGTADRIVITPDGRRLVLDVKTGRLDYLFSPKLAAQLAAYSRATARWMGTITFDRYGRYLLDDVEADGWQSVTGIDPHLGVVCHIDPATADVTIRYVDLEAGWRWARLGRRLYDTRKHRLVVLDELPPPSGGATAAAGTGMSPAAADQSLDVVEGLRVRVRAGLAVDGFEAALRARWPEGVPTLAPNGHQHTAAELDLVAHAVTRAEADAGVPF